MRFPRSYLRFLCLLAVILVLGGCSSSSNPAKRTLHIGTDATYPPFENLQNDQYIGFDIELGRAIGHEMNADVEFVNTAFDGIFPALLAQKFDMVMSSVTITDERKKRLAFSDPYYLAGQIVAVSDDEKSVHGLGDLNGQKVGIQLNTTASEVLKNRPQISVTKYNTIDLALQDLKNGNIKAVVGDAPTIRYFLAHGFRGLHTVGDLLTKEHYGIVMRPQDRQLQTDVNAALARLRASGQFAALEKKYFGTATPDTATKTSTTKTNATTTSTSATNAATTNQQLPWNDIFATLGRGLMLTLALTFAALLFGLPFGLLLSLGRLESRIVATICTAYVELFRGTPLLVQIIFVYYALPQLIGLNLSAPVAGALALTLNSAAYIAEIFRAGIQSIEVGQSEAARSLGLSRRQALRFVVIPQAARRVVPPLTNEAVALLKDSSLVSIIGLAELTRGGQELVSQLAAPLAIWPIVALFYLAVTLPLTRLVAVLERRANQGGRA